METSLERWIARELQLGPKHSGLWVARAVAVEYSDRANRSGRRTARSWLRGEISRLNPTEAP